MATFKNIRVPVGKTGKTRLQRVQVLATGQYKFVKNIKKSASKTGKKSGAKKSASKSKGGRKVGRKFTIPIAVLGGLFAGLAVPIAQAMNGASEEALKHITNNYTGFNPWSGRWSIDGLKRGLLPLLIGVLVHKFVGTELGVNRVLGRSRVPLLRI